MYNVFCPSSSKPHNSFSSYCPIYTDVVVSTKTCQILQFCNVGTTAYFLIRDFFAYLRPLTLRKYVFLPLCLSSRFYSLYISFPSPLHRVTFLFLYVSS